jgi:hypothetical protein
MRTNDTKGLALRSSRVAALLSVAAVSLVFVTAANSPDFLAAKLPTAGSSLTDVRRYEGGSIILGGVYD